MKFKVVSVDCGASALVQLRAAQQSGSPFHLLIIDSVMPQISGLELVKQIRAEQLSQAPRILLVGPNQNITPLVLEQEGIAATTAKPVQPSPLFDAIMQAFGYALSPKVTTAQKLTQWQDVSLLLVEDNELNRQVARELLAKVGINCVEAGNGAVAVEMVRQQQFDLVLMDIHMPVMDGLMATEQIRRLELGTKERLPIVAMTADAFAQDREKSSAVGMDGHISKPINTDELYQHLRRWLPAHKQKATDLSGDIFDSIELPGVDTARGLRYAAKDKQLYLRLLHGFAQQLKGVAEHLSAEVAAADQKPAIIRVHTLKGLAGTVGAVKMQESAKTLEMQLRNAEPPLALDGLLALVLSLLAACSTLPVDESTAQLDAASQADGDPATPGTLEQFEQLLREFVPALESLQAKTCGEFAQRLRQNSWPAEFIEDISQVQHLLDGYRFTQALAVVQKLLAKITQ
jgi:two-component system sensor histidine kinase/response regulator